MRNEVMKMAWKIYKRDNWLGLPFDRRNFAERMRQAWAIVRTNNAGSPMSDFDMALSERKW